MSLLYDLLSGLLGVQLPQVNDAVLNHIAQLSPSFSAWIDTGWNNAVLGDLLIAIPLAAILLGGFVAFLHHGDKMLLGIYHGIRAVLDFVIVIARGVIRLFRAIFDVAQDGFDAVWQAVAIQRDPLAIPEFFNDARLARHQEECDRLERELDKALESKRSTPSTKEQERILRQERERTSASSSANKHADD